MGQLRFDSHWKYNDCRLLRLENDLLCVEVLPEIGGKIYRLYDKRMRRECLWQHPHTLPRVLPVGANFDDNYCGGWDELFPTGGPCLHQGEAYPDHGEYWARPCEWTVSRMQDVLSLHLTAEGPVTATRFERSLNLAADSPALIVRYRLTHLGEYPVDYLWAVHPALAVGPGQRFIIPAEAGEIASPGGGRLSDEAAAFRWPMVPGRRGVLFDYQPLPQHTGPGYEMLYLHPLQEGWFALHDAGKRCGFALAFDPRLFSCLWLFQSCGGWRGLHLAIVEPSTGYPYDLSQAAAAGRCSTLQPGQVLETQIAAVVYHDRDQINQVRPDGSVS